MTVAIISHEKCDLHDNGSSHHPESPLRLAAIRDQLAASGTDSIASHYEAPFATREQLGRVHEVDYIDHVFATAPGEGERIRLDGDTGMNQFSLEAALHGAGAAIMAVDQIMGDKHKRAFCIVRPPGHHAGVGHSAGFCIFNNVAIAAAHAIKKHGLKRIAIVDFDVHHGDGTEAIVANNPHIRFFSSFQHPYYPYSGADSDFPNVFNLPMKDGTPASEWREQVSEWFPVIEDFRPELMIISAGFDSHHDDDMGGFNLVEDDYVWITRELCQIADKYSDGRVVSCLEGGYELQSLGRSAVAHIEALAL